MLRTAVAAILVTLLAPAPKPGAARPAPAPAPAPATRLRLVPAPDGNEARFRVKEQLAILTMPNEAVGTTSRISGALVLEDGKVVAGESRFSVPLDSLHTDRERRDGYIKHRTLETDKFPTAGLAVTALPGLPWPLPASGQMTFQLVGDLTIHGVTRPSTWQVTADAKDGGFSGTAITRVKFEDFGMTQPRVAIVLSVEDDIALEYQFHLVPDRSAR